MKKKNASKKSPSVLRPNYVAKKHWASAVKLSLTVYPVIVTVSFTAVASAFGWFAALAEGANSLLGQSVVTDSAVMIAVIILGSLVTLSRWAKQVKLIKALNKFHVDFYDDIIELYDEDGVLRRTFYGLTKVEVTLPEPSVIIPENAKLLKKLLCYKPIKFNYGNLTIEGLEGPGDKIKLYNIREPKKLARYLEKQVVITEPAAECTVEFTK